VTCGYQQKACVGEGFIDLARTMASFGWLAATQPAVLFSHIISAPATNHQPANSIFLSQQISTSHRPAERGHVL
jgi:hypothetical protein